MNLSHTAALYLICDLMFEPILRVLCLRPLSRFCLTGVSGVYWQLSETINGTSAKKSSV